jgi:two-component system sensor kinase FixL
MQGYRNPRFGLHTVCLLLLAGALCNWRTCLTAVYLVFLVSDAGLAAVEQGAPTLNPELAIHQNEEGASISSTAAPRWFETLWFRGLCLVIGLGIVMSVVRWRITAVRRHREEQQRYHEELSRVSRVTTMGELAASIAHEVNQPLCAILNDANSGQRLLSGEEIDVAEAKEAFQDIAAGAKRASDVIAHVRELLSRHTTERLIVNVNELLESSLELVRPGLNRKRIQLEMDVEPELPTVLGDQVQLQQVLINLLLNAADSIDNTDNGPRVIQILVSGHNSHVDISVRDTGAGFDQDKNMDEVFKAFYTTKPRGLGMGLAITRSIVEAHGGRIRAESNADQGATFTVTLPGYSGDANE